MKLFWKIYSAVFISFAVIASLSTYMIVTYELSDEEEHVVSKNALASRFIAEQIEKGYIESRWPFDSLMQLSKRDDFLFWWVVRDDGTIHLADNASFIGTRAYAYFPQIEKIPGSEKTFLNKKHYYGVFVKSIGTEDNWSFWFGFSTKHISATSRKIILSAMAFSVSASAILGIILYFTINYFIKPINDLAEGAAKIGKGELNYRVKVQSEDELGHLARSFNKMTEDLKKTTTSVDNLNREIIGRKQAEEKIEHAAQEWRTTFDSISDMVSIHNKDYKIVRVNKSFADAFKMKPQEIIGKTCCELIHGTKEPPLTCPHKQTLDTRKSKRTEFFEPHLGIYLEVSTSPILDKNGAIIGSVHIVKDITERKKVEETMKNLNKELEVTVAQLTISNRELQDFAHVAAHDLKTPLRAIATLADWISTDYADKLDEQGQEQIKMLIRRSQRVSEMIDAILRYSELRNVMQKEEVDLNTLLSEVISDIAAPENIAITVENELPAVKCEKTRIMQVFQNLLSNAIKYMDKPRGQIRIGCVEEDGFWKFSVADNGPGIEEKYFEKIFEIFQTLSTRDEIEATGIGLSIVEKIIKMYEGRIWVESEVGNGSTFFFTLPKALSVTNNEKQLLAASC